MPINAAADRLALDQDFFRLNFDLGAAPVQDGVIPALVGAQGGAVTFDADSTGFTMIPQVAGESPVFSLTVDGTQVLSFDPLDLHVVVEAGSWALLIAATTPTGQVQREFDLAAGSNQVGFAQGEVDDATAISFTLHGFGENPPFDAVRFVSIAASEVTFAEGHDPDAAPWADDGAGGDAGDQGHGPDLVSLAARVSGDILHVSVGLDAAGAFKVLALPADQDLDSAEDFDAAFDAGIGAGIGETGAAGVVTIPVQLAGRDASALRIWAVAIDPAHDDYESAAMFVLPENGMGGGGLLDLSPGDAPFAATLGLNAPAPAAVTATVGLFAADRGDGAAPLSTATVVIAQGGTQAPVVFEGFDPTASGAEWFVAEVIGTEGPAALEVSDSEVGFNAEGVAQADDGGHGAQDDGAHDDAPGDGAHDDAPGDGPGDGPSPEILSFAATAGATADGAVTFEIAFDWAVSGIDADNFVANLRGHAEGDALIGTPVTADGGYTWTVQVAAPAGEYRLGLDFVVDADLSAVSPAGDTTTGPGIPETVAQAELDVDRAGPDIRSAFVKGDQLHIAFDEAIGSVHPLSFTVTAGGEALTILSVAAPRDDAAVFTLSRPVTADEIVTLSHAGNGVQDALFNPAPAFEDLAIRNLARPVSDPDDDDAEDADGDFEFDDDGALVGHFDVPGGGGAGPVRLSGATGAVRVTPPADVSVAATVSAPAGDADARAGAASMLIDMATGFSGRGAQRVATKARELEDGREMAVMQLSPTRTGDAAGRLDLHVERDPGVLSMVGVDARGLGADARLAITDADLLQVSGKAEIQLDRVATAVMDRGAQTVTVSSAMEGEQVALFAGGGWDQVTLDGLTGRTRVDLGAGKDVVVSTGYSADELFGGMGDDEIHSGRGRDLVRAGQGDDVGYGEGGADRMFGGGGADRLYGGAGRDEVRGGVDDDVIAGGDDDDRLWGGDGDDRASGDAGDDRIFGGGGDDLVFGGAGDDYLDGQGGADDLSGGEGDDELRGGGGDDALRGGAGADDLRGGAGADRIDGGADADVLRGGDGADVFVFSAGSGADVVRDFEIGVDVIEAASLADWTAAQDAMTDTEDGVLLRFADGDQALLQGIAIADLDQADFLLG